MTDELADKTILLVDDDRDILATMVAALEDLGADIHTAADGHEALTQVEAHSPDLVILDQMLPKRSGLLVLEKLCRGKKPTDPPQVIMITGNTGRRHKIYAESLGVSAYLNKPFRMERLLDQVKKLLG